MNNKFLQDPQFDTFTRAQRAQIKTHLKLFFLLMNKLDSKQVSSDSVQTSLRFVHFKMMQRLIMDWNS